MHADRLTSAGLFAGVGGIEEGLRLSGVAAQALYETSEPARAVLLARFPDIELYGDITAVERLPAVDMVAAGFPCADLSPAGRTKGIRGSQSGLVMTALKLIGLAKPPWVLLENVPHMLVLHRGYAMRVITSELEKLGYAWAYRTIDSQCFGLPQRRRRVFLLAAQEGDPAAVLFRADAGEIDCTARSQAAYGFYWTEGNRGLGWAPAGLPPLKGSSTLNIPSPPAVWRTGAPLGERIVTPSIESAEVAHGFPAGWTASAAARARWKLVGNAVSVPVARWIGEGVVTSVDLASVDTVRREILGDQDGWPKAASGESAKRWRVEASTCPTRERPNHLTDLLDAHGSAPLSRRATAGFRDRLLRSRLRYDPRFMIDLEEHVATYA